MSATQKIYVAGFRCVIDSANNERIEETDDPELAFARAMVTYLKKGYSKDWVSLCLKSIEVRKDLTAVWESRGVKQGQEFATLPTTTLIPITSISRSYCLRCRTHSASIQAQSCL